MRHIFLYFCVFKFSKHIYFSEIPELRPHHHTHYSSYSQHNHQFHHNHYQHHVSPWQQTKHQSLLDSRHLVSGFVSSCTSIGDPEQPPPLPVKKKHSKFNHTAHTVNLYFRIFSLLFSFFYFFTDLYLRHVLRSVLHTYIYICIYYCFCVICLCIICKQHPYAPIKSQTFLYTYMRLFIYIHICI